MQQQKWAQMMKDKFIPASVRIETPNHKTQQHPPSPPQQKQEKKALQTNSRHQTKPRKILSFSKFNTSAAKLEEDYLCEREKKE
jgi:hypothetical protein